MNREQSLALVSQLIDATEREIPEEDFAEAVFADTATDALEALMAASRLPALLKEQQIDVEAVDVEALSAVGWLLYLRSKYLDGPQEDSHHALAMAALYLAFQIEPSLVPLPMIEHFVRLLPEQAFELGEQKLMEFDLDGDERSLDVAYALLSAVVRNDQPDSPHQGSHQYAMGCVWRRFYQVSAYEPHLLTALLTLTMATEHLPGDFADRGACVWAELSQLHQIYYATYHTPEQLERAVDCARQALAVTPTSGVAVHADLLSDCLRIRAEASGDATDIAEAVDLSRQAVAADPANGRFLSRLAVALRVSHQITPDPALLDEAIAQGRLALEHTPKQDPNRPARLGNLAAALAIRNWTTGAPQDLREAITLTDEAMRSQTPADPDPGMVHTNLSEMLRRYGEQTSDVDCLKRAVQTGRTAIGVTAGAHVHLGLYWSNLALALRVLAELTGDRPLIEEAIAAARTAVDATPREHPERSGRVNTLVIALLLDYESNGTPSSLTEAVRLGQDNLPQGDERKTTQAGAMANLAMALSMEFARTEEVEHLRKAAEMAEASLSRLGEDKTGRARVLNISLAVWRLAVLAGLSDLEPIAGLIEAARSLLAQEDSASPERSELLVALVNAHLFRYEVDPSGVHLDGAVQAAAQLVGAGDYHVHLPDHLLAIADPFWRLYQTTADPAALDVAITAGQRAHALLGDFPRAKATVAQNLSVLLRQGAMYRGPSSLTEAIRLAREAEAFLRANGEFSHQALSGLSAALQEHYKITGNRDSLDEAVRISRSLRHRLPSGERLADGPSVDLAFCLHLLHQATGDLTPLDEAIGIFEDLVAAEAGGMLLARRLINLGQMLLHRFERVRASIDLVRGMECFERAALETDATPYQRFVAASLAGDLRARGRFWNAALDDYALAIEQLPHVVGPRLSPDAQELRLRETTGIGCLAASCALHLGQSARALQLLEAGRAVLIAHALDLRSSLHDADLGSPGLATRWEQLRRESSLAPTSATAEFLARRHDHAARWEQIRAEMSSLPSSAGAWGAPIADSLMAAAAEGPIVIVNTTRLRTDAIIVTSDAIEAVGLTLSLDQAEQLIHTLHRALPRPDAHDEVFEVLEALWTGLAEPVLDRLGFTEARDAIDAPRLWWCPTGPLTFLPLAAAGLRGTRCTVLDRVTSSFIPTIRALQHARRPAVPGPRRPPLAVAVSQAPGQPPLPEALREVEFLVGRDPDVIPLVGPQATPDSVLRHLAIAGSAHFACHARVEPQNPSSSALVLHDAMPLTVRDISRLDIDADLVFLSACETALGGRHLADEAITLATAFLTAGYREVLATLWPIYDDEAGTITRDVHSFGQGPARALHQALHHARARNPLRPDLWASHLHFGR